MFKNGITTNTKVGDDDWMDHVPKLQRPFVNTLKIEVEKPENISFLLHFLQVSESIFGAS